MYESHKCLVCDKEFGDIKQRPLLMEHMKENHSDVGFLCNECGRIFSTTAQLLNHESEHMRIPMSAYNPQKVEVEVGDASRELLMCRLCGGMFTLQSALDQHLPIHFNNEDALSNEELADIFDIQLGAACTSDIGPVVLPKWSEVESQTASIEEENTTDEECIGKTSKTATKRWTEESDSPSHARKSSKKKKRKRLKALKKSSGTVIVKHLVKEVDKSCQSQALKLKNESEAEDGAAQSTIAVRRSESRENKHDSSKTAGQLENAVKVCSKPQLQIRLPHGSISGGKERNNALNPDQVKEMIRTGKMTISMKVPVTKLQAPPSGQTPSSSSIQQSTSKTVVDSVFTPGTSVPGPRSDARAAGSNSDTKQSSSPSSKEGDTHKPLPMADNDAPTPASLPISNDDKAASSSKSDAKAAALSMLDIMRKTSNVQLKVGTTEAGKVAELSQTGEKKLSVNEFAPNPDQVKEMIRTEKKTLSIKVPVTKLQTPSSGETPSSASMQQSIGKTLVVVDSAFTPGTSVPGPRVNVRAAGELNSDTIQSLSPSSKEGDTHKPLPLADNDAPTPASLPASNDDKAASSSK
ncbi:uncharacterized protein [Amphiura filiformis]|uniref:uncharacterized protein n=1 Tax=Amphiura filiformis TaxID=82378 RepID=UPI003B226937